MSEMLDKLSETVGALCEEYGRQLLELRQQRDALRAELEKLRGELDDAEERASEAEERCAAEWEKDCGQALRILAQVTKFEWDQDGSPADEVREHIQMTLESLEKQVSSLRAELAAAKEERTALAAHVERLEKALKGVCKLRKKTEATHQAAYEAMFKLPGRKAFEDAADALAAHDADVKVAVLREVADKLRSEESSNSNLHAEFIEAEAIQIKAEADRIEKGKHAK